MLFWENVVITLALIFFVLVFRTSTPPSPPSFAAMRNHTSITQGMWTDFKILMRNRNFVLTTISYTTIFCIYSGLGVVISQLFAPVGLKSGADALIGMTFVFCGAFACAAAGIYLDRSNAYLKSFKFVLGVTVVVFLMFAFLISITQTLWSTILFAVFVGLTITPIVPIGFGFCTELTHPVSPALVIGLMCCFASYCCFAMVQVYLIILAEPLDETLNPLQTRNALIAMSSLAFVGFGLSFLIREDLRRLSSVSMSSLDMKL